MTSGLMEKRGYPTWDVGVVMNAFAAKYPDYVEKFVKAECAGIDFWIKNPDKTAEIIAEELSLPLADATRMMNGTAMVPCDQQLTDRTRHIGQERPVRRYAGCDGRLPGQAGTVAEAAAARGFRGLHRRRPTSKSWSANERPGMVRRTRAL